MIEGQTKAIGDVFLHGMHRCAKFFHRLASLGGSQFGGCAMFIGGADKHHLMAAPAHVACKKIGGQLAAHKIAQVLDPVDIGNGRCDQNPCHDAPFGVFSPL